METLTRVAWEWLPSNSTPINRPRTSREENERSATFWQFSAPLRSPPPRFLFRLMWRVRVESIDDTLGDPKRRLRDVVFTLLCNIIPNTGSAGTKSMLDRPLRSGSSHFFRKFSSMILTNLINPSNEFCEKR